MSIEPAPFMSPEKPRLAPVSRPPTLCPYCEHRSPPGSKFCNECGAALHLQPCPHCGALNDITLTRQCGRCQQPLALPETEPEQDPPEVAAAPALETLAGPWLAAEPGPRRELVFAPEALPWAAPPRRWPWLLGLGLILPALAGLGGYRLAQRQQAELIAAPPAAGSTVPSAALPTLPAPVAAAPPSRLEPAAALVPTSDLVVPVPASAAASAPPARPPVLAAPARPALPRDTPSGAAVSPRPAAPPGPCTEAVAALGLCSPAAEAQASKPTRRP
jgi:hypothetical protein